MSLANRFVEFAFDFKSDGKLALALACLDCSNQMRDTGTVTAETWDRLRREYATAYPERFVRQPPSERREVIS